MLKVVAEFSFDQPELDQFREKPKCLYRYYRHNYTNYERAAHKANSPNQYLKVADAVSKLFVKEVARIGSADDIQCATVIANEWLAQKRAHVKRKV